MTPQELIRSALADLRQCSSRVAKLALFSANEQLADIPTRDLVYILVPYVLSEVTSRIRTTDREERIDLASSVKVRTVALDVRLFDIHQARQRYLESFIHYLEQYEVITEEDKTLYGRPASSVTDPAKRRELKIKQYKREKDIKAHIEVSTVLAPTHFEAEECGRL